MTLAKTVARATVIASLAVTASFTHARADEPSSDETPPPKPKRVRIPAPPPPAPNGMTGDESSQVLGPLERLPASAYPSEPIRGIYGGSLWRIFHGLQWPYYPKTGIGVSGDLWVDTSYQRSIRGSGNEQGGRGITQYLQVGRQVLRVTPTWTGGEWFAQAQTELVANEDQGAAQPNSLFVSVDDLWIRAGRWKTFDVQLGRFEGWEIYHFGLGLDLHSPERVGPTAALLAPGIYGVTALMYRPQSFGAGAVHIYPTDWLRFELEGRYGSEGQNGLGGRGVGILDFGSLKFKAGGEYEDLTPQLDTGKGDKKIYGVGGALQGVIDPWAELGISGAYGWQATVDPVSGNIDPNNSFQTYSLGAFANVHVIGDLMVGGGINYTFFVDQNFDSALGRTENRDQWQGFGAVQYILWKQIYLRGIVGYALANFNPVAMNVPYQNSMVSARLRAEMLF